MEPSPWHDPQISIPDDAYVASSAVVVGDVLIGSGCVIDHGATIVATGSSIELGTGVVVMPGAVLRSSGGVGRPAHPIAVGVDCLIGPYAPLAGCKLDSAVYVATQVMIFHGAVVGEGSRLDAGSIVHTNAQLPPRTRLGMRHFAVARLGGGPAVVTGDLEEARALLAEADFFGNVFDFARPDQEDLVELHRRSARTVAAEIMQRRG